MSQSDADRPAGRARPAPPPPAPPPPGPPPGPAPTAPPPGPSGSGEAGWSSLQESPGDAGVAPDEAPPVPEAPAGPEGAGRATSLHSDLDAVAGARPERAFNVGAGIGVLLTVAVVIFVFQNNHATDFDWLWFDFSLPLWSVLVGCIVAGALAATAGFVLHRRRRRRIASREQAAGRLREALPGEPQPEGRRFGLFRRTARA